MVQDAQDLCMLAAVASFGLPVGKQKRQWSSCGDPSVDSLSPTKKPKVWRGFHSPPKSGDQTKQRGSSGMGSCESSDIHDCYAATTSAHEETVKQKVVWFEQMQQFSEVEQLAQMRAMGQENMVLVGKLNLIVKNASTAAISTNTVKNIEMQLLQLHRRINKMQQNVLLKHQRKQNALLMTEKRQLQQYEQPHRSPVLVTSRP